MKIKYEANDGTLHDTKKECHLRDGKSVVYACMCISCGSVISAIFSDEDEANSWCDKQKEEGGRRFNYIVEEWFVDEKM
jgi:hypothetical protein